MLLGSQPHPFDAERIGDARAWQRQQRMALLHDAHPRHSLRAQVEALHEAIAAAGDDGAARIGAHMRKRHALALRLSHLRVRLTKGLIAELGLVSTQHVARALMVAAFGQAVSTAWLDDHFAQPGRRATVKHMAAATAAAQARPQLLAQYARLYRWYARAQRRAAAVHAARWERTRAARAVGGGGGGINLAAYMPVSLLVFP